MKKIDWPIKFVQLETVLCGKKGCNKRHGPYWYGYNWDAPQARKVYIGKELPRELAHLTNDRQHWQEPADGQAVDSSAELVPELVMDDARSETWFDTIGARWDWTREAIRKKVYHFTHSAKHDNNTKTACAAWFCQLCVERGWKVPR